MFKNWKKHVKLWQVFLMVLLAMVTVVALVFAFFNFQRFVSYLKGLLSAIMSFIYGFIIAYLCNPLYKDKRIRGNSNGSGNALCINIFRNSLHTSPDIHTRLP